MELTNGALLHAHVKAPEAHLRARLQPKSLVINLFVDMKALFMQVRSLRINNEIWIIMQIAT